MEHLPNSVLQKFCINYDGYKIPFDSRFTPNCKQCFYYFSSLHRLSNRIICFVVDSIGSITNSYMLRDFSRYPIKQSVIQSLSHTYRGLWLFHMIYLTRFFNICLCRFHSNSVRFQFRYGMNDRQIKQNVYRSSPNRQLKHDICYSECKQ